MDIVQAGRKPIAFISSAAADFSQDLLTVKYQRVQPQSPKYLTVYEGIDQSVNIVVTTVVVRAAPEPVIALYDFIMTTFVPENSDASTSNTPQLTIDEEQPVVAQTNGGSGKIRVLVKLAGIQGGLDLLKHLVSDR